MNDDYKRGYGKGYQAGCRRSDAEIARVRDEAKNAATRAENAELQQGIGHCIDCKWWSKGGGGPGWEACSWGKCMVPDAPGTPYTTWAKADDGARITVMPHFGCVLFIKKETP